MLARVRQNLSSSCDEILCQYGNNPQQTDAKGHNHPRTNSGSLAMLAAMAVTGFSSVSGARRGGVTARTRARKQRPAASTVETTVVDVIEEPVPGVVTITEFEEVRIPMPDSDEETKD